jgi:amidase
LSVVAGTEISANSHNNDCHYERSVNPAGLKGTRIGVVRERLSGIHNRLDLIYEDAVRVISDAGATVVDPADIPTLFEISTRVSQNIVLGYDLKQDINAYLKSRIGIPVRSLGEVIAFNRAHAEAELMLFGQQLFEQIESSHVDQAKYQQGLARMRKIGGPLGIDAVLQRFRLNALVMPTGPPASIIDHVNGQLVISLSSMPAAIAGYPSISVPMGRTFGLPVGITFVGTAFQEKTLIRLASGFEHVRQARTSPKFLSTLPFENPEFWRGSLAGKQRLEDNLTEREPDDRKITLQ